MKRVAAIAGCAMFAALSAPTLGHAAIVVDPRAAAGVARLKTSATGRTMWRNISQTVAAVEVVEPFTKCGDGRSGCISLGSGAQTLYLSTSLLQSRDPSAMIAMTIAHEGSHAMDFPANVEISRTTPSEGLWWTELRAHMIGAQVAHDLAIVVPSIVLGQSSTGALLSPQATAERIRTASLYVHSINRPAGSTPKYPYSHGIGSITRLIEAWDNQRIPTVVSATPISSGYSGWAYRRATSNAAWRWTSAGWQMGSLPVGREVSVKPYSAGWHSAFLGSWFGVPDKELVRWTCTGPTRDARVLTFGTATFRDDPSSKAAATATIAGGTALTLSCAEGFANGDLAGRDQFMMVRWGTTRVGYVATGSLTY